MSWHDAARIAFLAMGTRKQRSGRRMETIWLADEDRLAWWCLTELIMSRAAAKAALSKSGA